MSITIHSGSILDSKADCIVNPANSFLNHGGGLAYIINRAASLGVVPGDPLRYKDNPEAVARYTQDHASAPLIATGNVHVTSAGLLPFRGIIHAVGPIWNGGEFSEGLLLMQAYANSCEAARERDWTSIAFPAISAGIFGYPPEEVARIAVQIATVFENYLDIEFWPFGFEAEFRAALS